MAKDRELQDHERAHTGKPGMKVRHGANVTRSNIEGAREVKEMKKRGFPTTADYMAGNTDVKSKVMDPDGDRVKNASRNSLNQGVDVRPKPQKGGGFKYDWER